MAWRIINTEVQYYTESELLGILNEDNYSPNYLSLAAAIAGVGLATAAIIIINHDCP